MDRKTEYEYLTPDKMYQSFHVIDLVNQAA